MTWHAPSHDEAIRVPGSEPLGSLTCGEEPPCESAYCTRHAGHAGRHMAHGMAYGVVFHAWPGDHPPTPADLTTDHPGTPPGGEETSTCAS